MSNRFAASFSAFACGWYLIPPRWPLAFTLACFLYFAYREHQEGK